MKPWESYTPELVTDLYELTMAASYLEERMSGEATFSLFIRDYPRYRSFFVAAGLERLLDLLAAFRFDDDSLAYIDSIGRFSPRFIEYLRNFRFTGTVRAIPEGRIFFAQEPLVEVTGPIIEAQVIETLIINVIQIETMIASKAARIVQAAGGKALIDFGMRRSHGVDGSVEAARASYLTGFAGTSNLLAGKIHNIPVFGTMAHSYVTSFKREVEAFKAFAKTFPDHSVFLIDTYDTESGARKAVEVAKAMAANGKKLSAVRLDSGDLADLSRKVRRILNDAGLSDIRIMASGNLDEFEIQDLIEKGALIDVYAAGTHLCVSADAPYLDIAYKLVEYNGTPILKLSSGKKTWVGRKVVQRYYRADGKMDHDILGLLAQEDDSGEQLLEIVMKDGKRLREKDSMDRIRKRFKSDLERIPERLRDLKTTDRYDVQLSEKLRKLDEDTALERRQREVEAVRG